MKSTTAGGPFGIVLETGLTAFNTGSALVQGTNLAYDFTQDTAIPAASDFFNSFGSSGSSSGSTGSIFSSPFSNFNPSK